MARVDSWKNKNSRINFFEEQLKQEYGVSWKTVIAFLIERTPFASSFGDACLNVAGGYSIDLNFGGMSNFQ